MRFTARFLQSALIVLLLCVGASGTSFGQRPTQQLDLRPTREFAVVEKWRGTWDVRATRRSPQPETVITYVETCEWVLDNRYLRCETSRKSDGGQSMSMFWFDVLTKTYRTMLFDAAGLAVELPPPSWNESTQTMESRASRLNPTNYSGSATFAEPNTIRWKALWKDWKGTVFLDLEGTSVRRR